MLTSLPWVPLSTAFLAASFMLAVTPGPAVLYIVTRSATQGRAAGLASVGGIALGNVGNAMMASLGLAALFAISTLAFSLVKYAGALYLIYVGIRTLRSTPVKPPSTEIEPLTSLRRVFLDGFAVALFNPKTALFFAAFLPQFLDPASATVAGTMEFSIAFVLIAATTDSAYALTASTAGRWLVRQRGAANMGRFLSGGAFIALGVFTAVTGRRPQH